MVVRIAEHVYDDASKRILQLLTHRLQVFFVKDQNLCSLQRYGHEAINLDALKNTFASMCLRSLRFIWLKGGFPIFAETTRSELASTC